MATVFILQGNHPSTPGHVMTAHATRAGADAGAAELVNLILADLDPEAPKATASTWEDGMKRARQLQADAQDVDVGDLDDVEAGDVWITELEIAGYANLVPLLRDVDTAFHLIEREGSSRIRNALADVPQRVRDALLCQQANASAPDQAALACNLIGQDDRALGEGWCLIEGAGGLLEIDANDDSPIFVRDNYRYADEAAAFVKAKAAEGSAYHIAALARVGQPG